MSHLFAFCAGNFFMLTVVMVIIGLNFVPYALMTVVFFGMTWLEISSQTNGGGNG